MKYWIVVFIASAFMVGCTQKQDPSLFYVDQNWIEVHFNKNMSIKQLVDIRERLAPLGVVLKYLTIQQDSTKVITLFQIEVHDGKGKIARSRTEFLDEIPYGIRIQRNDNSDEGFKVGPLYTKRPQ